MYSYDDYFNVSFNFNKNVFVWQYIIYIDITGKDSMYVVFCKGQNQMHLFFVNLILKWFCVFISWSDIVNEPHPMSLFSHDIVAKFSSDNIWDNCLCKMHEDFRTWPSRLCSHSQCKGLERSFKQGSVFSNAPVVDHEESLCWSLSCHALLINGS